jgi:hypothetical protein
MTPGFVKGEVVDAKRFSDAGRFAIGACESLVDTRFQVAQQIILQDTLE